MKAPRFDYRRPESLQQAVDELRQADGQAKVIAGGQSLGPMLNLRLTRPAVVVDVSSVPELRAVSMAGGRIRIGACVTHGEIEDGAFSPLRGHPMQWVAGVIAYRAVRNRGTVGGSLGHADPAADWVVSLSALDARIELASPRGSRRIGMPEFMLGAYTTVLEADELIAAIEVPAMADDARWGYYKICRKVGEFADASCAAWLDPASRTARIALGALDGAPRLLGSLAASVAREGPSALDRDAIVATARAAMPGKDAIDQHLHATAIERCLQQMFSEVDVGQALA